MNYTLHIIDQNARLYPFEINEIGFKLIVKNKTFQVNSDNTCMEEFYKILTNGTPFILKFSDDSFVSFTPDKLSGIQVVPKL